MKQDIAAQSLPCLTFGNLSGVPGLVHGVFTRHGGVSLPPYESLNVSWGNGDSPGAVLENLTRIKNATGLERLVSSRQFHGDAVNFIDKESVEGTGGAPAHADRAARRRACDQYAGLGLRYKDRGLPVHFPGRSAKPNNRQYS